MNLGKTADSVVESVSALIGDYRVLLLAMNMIAGGAAEAQQIALEALDAIKPENSEGSSS